ncbi:protein kinase, putative [Entamoeba nuttalli P19]|uniref:Protein kinase, putative n=2 Tax=Entamoeba nuttalli TaxID=412467 RepID=K2GYF6_ENTNP|nr:protein kinase, putative [Entamoeba nuttalli P19]EKE40278.1 protein kinase, putative [Entamoeba nuttalli P19]|eukprot:XP_008857382.1 protein kinase, putative [Entamoeba nuttalli P19]
MSITRKSLTEGKGPINRIIRVEIISGENLFPVAMTSGESYVSVNVGDKSGKMRVSRKTTNNYFHSPDNRIEFRNVSPSTKEIIFEFHDHEKRKSAKNWGKRININQLLPFNTNHIKSFELEPIEEKVSLHSEISTPVTGIVSPENIIVPSTQISQTNITNSMTSLRLEKTQQFTTISAPLPSSTPIKMTPMKKTMSPSKLATKISSEYQCHRIIQPDLLMKKISKPKITVSLYLFPEVDPKTEKSYKTLPLHNAVERSDLYKILTLLESGKVDVNAQDEQGNTALHIASYESYNEHIILALLKNAPTIDVNKENLDKNTPFHFFCKNFSNPNCQEAMELFFRHGVNLEAQNKNLETALHTVVRNNSIRMLLVSKLLERGVDVNAATNRQSTALHYAIHNERTDLLSILLEHKAKLDLPDDHGQTPFMLAKTKSERYFKTVNDFKELIDYLIEIKASDNAIAMLVKNKMFKYKLRNQTPKTLEKIGILSSVERIALIQKFKLLPNVPEVKEITENENEQEERKKLLELIEQGKFVIEPKEIEFLANIGSGASGIVYTAKYKNVTVAVKTLKATNMEEVKEFQQEYGVLSKLQHENIVRFYGVIVKKQFSMVMEYCSKGSLYDIISKKENSITWETVFDYAEQIALGMDYLHSRTPQILHRDLKSLNILVTMETIQENGNSIEIERLKICDFGLSRFDSEITTSTKDRGTYAYCAPEVYYNQRYTTQSDVYSYGIILWELIYRVIYQKYQRPFQEFPELTMDLQIIIQSATCDLRPTIPPSTPQKMATLIRQCVMKEQENRPKSGMILTALQEMKKDFKSNPQLWNASIIQQN